MTTLAGRSVVVVGGSRGLGRGVAEAAREGGARVTVVARTVADGVEGDATDEAFAGKVLADRRPGLLVVTAGAVPEMRPLTEHTWESFSTNWHADVRIAFAWLRAALRLPLAPGSLVVVFGSAAELRGSPLSGGYAGAKATVRLITGYAAAEARNLGIAMTTVLPVITPGTTIGEVALQAYANGGTPPDAPTPASIARAVLSLAGGFLASSSLPGGSSAGGSLAGGSSARFEVAAAYVADRDGLRPLG